MNLYKRIAELCEFLDQWSSQRTGRKWRLTRGKSAITIRLEDDELVSDRTVSVDQAVAAMVNLLTVEARHMTEDFEPALAER